jgi:hypothetical protein
MPIARFAIAFFFVVGGKLTGGTLQGNRRVLLV